MAGTYSHSQVSTVYHYVLNQEEHHKKHTFKEEYTRLLRDFQMEHEEKYLFDWLD